MDCGIFNRVVLLKNKASEWSEINFQLWNIWQYSKYNIERADLQKHVILTIGAKEKESTTSCGF